MHTHNMFLYLGVMLIFVFSRISGDQPNIPYYEYNALWDLYNATNGAGWYINHIQPGVAWNFSETANPCVSQWQGVLCSNSTFQINETDYFFIEAIILPLHKLVGQLPSSIGDLAGMLLLDLSANLISGTLPESIGNLTNLIRLNISENRFTGKLPSSIGNLVNLERLDLAGIVLDEVSLKQVIAQDPQRLITGFSGELPATLSNLTKLKYFSIGFNAFSGSPSVVGALIELEELYIYLNHFNGTIPETFKSLKKLHKFSCGSNYFTGDGFEVLRNNVNLTQYIIGVNNFNGSIPAVVGERAGLVFLDMSYNHFHGSIPENLSNLTQLALFNIANNSLVGMFPEYVCNMKNMVYLDLGSNSFGSSIPTCLSDLSELQFLELSVNRLTGTIPVELGSLTLMEHFSLGGNYLHGTIPASLGIFTGAYLFDLGNNLLSGSIPDTLGQLMKVQFFNLSNNALDGTIPSSILSIVALTTLDLSFNALTGTIDKTIGRLSHLQFMYLQYNLLRGTLPSTLSNLAELQSLLLNNNDFSGPISEVFNATLQRNLSIIQISSNRLTGELPDEIFQLPGLQTFVAVVNCFHGSIPLSVCSSRNLLSLTLDGLQSARFCQRRILPLISSAYLTKYQLKGGIPSCIFGLPTLKALHLSGNGLTGSLPENAVISPTIESLSLSNNILTGSIPLNFQTKQWYLFDLSFNHLDGEMSSNFASVRYNTSIHLQTNRLSGRLPDTIVDARDISILKGNLFSCSLDKHQLPDHDNDKDHYVCGSSAFNSPYYLWLATAVVAIIAAVALWRKNLWFTNINLSEVTETLRKYYDFPITPNSGVQRENSQSATLSTISNESGGAMNSTSMYVVSNKLEDRMRDCTYICQLMDINCKTTICTGLYAGTVFLLCYVVLHVFYSTHTTLDAYFTSAAYLAGKVPFAVELVLLVIFMLVVLVVYRVLLFLYEHDERSKDRSSEISTVKISYFSHASLRKAPYFAAYFLINIVVVVGVNAAFVVVSLYEANSLVVIAQILLSLFKLIWNNILSMSAIAFFTERSATNEQGSISRVFYLQLFVLLLNNIAIPCFVVATISPGCFYYVFRNAPSVESKYKIQECVGIVLETGCNLYSTSVNEIAYDPPFSYSYQCSSSFVKNYAPTFIYMCFATAFVVPLIQVWMIRLHRNSQPGSCRYNILSLYNQFPVPEHLSVEGIHIPTKHPFRKMFNANQILLNQYNMLGILMTFGVVFPPLAVALAFTICLTTLFARIKIGYFLCKCVEVNRLDYVDTVNSECARVTSLQMMRNSVWMLLTFSSFFYTLFLFDTLGDAVGFEGSYWVLIVVPLFPVVMYGGFRLHLYVTNHITEDDLKTVITSSTLYEATLSPLNRTTATNTADLHSYSTERESL